MTSHESHTIVTNEASALKVDENKEANEAKPLLPPNDEPFGTSSGDNDQVTKNQRRKEAHKWEPVKDTCPATPPKRRKPLEQTPADENSDSVEIIIPSASRGSSSVVQAFSRRSITLIAYKIKHDPSSRGRPAVLCPKQRALIPHLTSHSFNG